MAKQPHEETRGHRMLARWQTADKSRTDVLIAEHCECSKAAVWKWRSLNMRPKAEYRRILRSLCGIPEDAWLTAKERARQRRVDRVTGEVCGAT